MIGDSETQKWENSNNNGWGIAGKVKTFLGILDNKEDIENLKENFNTKIQKGQYGISIENSLPDFMQSETHKKEKAIGQMKEAFSQLALDQLTKTEMHDLVEFSAHGVIGSSASLPFASVSNKSGPSSQTINMPFLSSFMKKKQNTKVGKIPPSEARIKKDLQSSSIEESSISKPDRVVNESRCLPFVMSTWSFPGVFRKFSKNVTDTTPLNRFSKTKHQNLFESKGSSPMANTSAKGDMETGSSVFMERPSFQSSIRLRCSQTARAFSSGTIQSRHALAKNCHTVSIDEFVQSSHILSKENITKIEKESASLRNMASVSHECTYDPGKFIGFDESDDTHCVKWISQNEFESAQDNLNPEEHTVLTPLLSCSSLEDVDHSHQPALESAQSEQTDTSQNYHVLLSDGEQKSVPTTEHPSTSCLKQEHCNENNSAMFCKPNRVHPVDFEVGSNNITSETEMNSQSLQQNINNQALETNINNNAVASPRNNQEHSAEITTDESTTEPQTSSDYGMINRSNSENASFLNVEFVEGDVQLTGEEALKHYKLFSAVEKAVQLSKLQIIRQQVVSDYLWKIDIVDEVYEAAKAYYSKPKGKAREKWKSLRRDISQHSKHSMLDIRVKLTTFGNFLPLFTYIIILFQVMSISLLCSLYGFNRVGVQPVLEFHEGIKTYLGVESAHRWIVPNMWIGPKARSLVAAGAVFGLCMRDNYQTRLAFLRIHNFSKTDELGCCEVAARNTAGTTTLEECYIYTAGVGIWKRGILCSKRISGKNSVAHIMKPCCIDLNGMCIHTSHKHCVFAGGIFHQFAEHCSQVNCASDVCQLGGLKADPYNPWLPYKPNQWGRYFLSLIYTHGIFHAIVLLAGNWVMMRQMEMTIGWLRMLLVYVCSGINGCLCAAIISPYTPQVSTSASLMGTVGMLTVELSQAWMLIPQPWKEAGKIAGLMISCLALGTLPLISNYAMLVGFFTGMICAIAFLPYITFGWWTRKSRIILCSLSMSVLILTHFIFVYLFIYVQDVTECTSCTTFECVHYAGKMCDETLLSYTVGVW